MRQGLGAKLAGRDLQVLLAHCAHHVARRQSARGDLVRIEPDAHRIVAGAEDQRLADARQARQLVLDLQVGVVAQIERVIGLVRRKQIDDHGEVGRLLLGGHALAHHSLWQP